MILFPYCEIYFVQAPVQILLLQRFIPWKPSLITFHFSSTYSLKTLVATLRVFPPAAKRGCQFYLTLLRKSFWGISLWVSRLCFSSCVLWYFVFTDTMLAFFLQLTCPKRMGEQGVCRLLIEDLSKCMVVNHPNAFVLDWDEIFILLPFRLPATLFKYGKLPKFPCRLPSTVLIRLYFPGPKWLHRCPHLAVIYFWSLVIACL